MENIWMVLQQTAAATLTALFLLILQRIFLDKLSPRWQYAVWQTTKNRSTPAALSDSASHRAAGSKRSSSSIRDGPLPSRGRNTTAPVAFMLKSPQKHGFLAIRL